MRSLIVIAALLALAACQKQTQLPAKNTSAAPAVPAGPTKGVDRSHKGQPAPAATFKDPDGGDISLANFKGTPVLVNLWATWCGPCREELPSLDRLAQSHDIDGELGLIAVSQDDGPPPSVVAFLKTLKIKDLGAYQDANMGLSGALGPDTVLPTTILYDASGKEVWRYVGALDWTGPDAAKLLAEAKPAAKG
jgi:thiol-disulfide isomerase/thioredoxin